MITITLAKIAIGSGTSDEEDLQKIKEILPPHDGMILLCGEVYKRGNKKTAQNWLSLIEGLNELAVNSTIKFDSIARGIGKSGVLKETRDLLDSYVEDKLSEYFENDDSIQSLIKEVSIYR